MNIRLGLLATLLASPLFATGCSSSDNSGTLTVVNQESFEITDIYVDNPGDDTFSDNLLGSVPLQMGDSITIAVDCGTYDVEIIDESGADCKVLDTDICASSDEWIITDAFCNLASRTNNNVKAPKAPTTLQIPAAKAGRFVSR